MKWEHPEPTVANLAVCIQLKYLKTFPAVLDIASDLTDKFLLIHILLGICCCKYFFCFFSLKLNHVFHRLKQKKVHVTRGKL